MKLEGTPMISSSAAITMTAAMAAPAIFKALMATFQTGQVELIPEWATRSKEPKNNPGLLQSYVTYDTLPGRRIGPTPFDGWSGRHCNEQSGRICGHSENESDVRRPWRRRTGADLEPLPHPECRRRRGVVPEGRSRRRPVRGPPRPDPH